MEGILDEESDYDEWISNGKTWLEIGDKCAMHHLYSLATEMYGLGIMKDPDAFRKPMLWYRFAKSCQRCGRTSDAQLAIKVIVNHTFPFVASLDYLKLFVLI